MTLASLLSLTGQKCKKEKDNWSNSIPLPDNWEEMRLLEKNTNLSSQYIQLPGNPRKMQNLTSHQRKTIKIDRI